MIIHKDKVKSEALLLLCRDLINSYENQNNITLNSDIDFFIKSYTQKFLKAMNQYLQPLEYYIRNQQVSRINLIMKSYKNLNKTLSKFFKENQQFQPFMLCIALLSTWFAELEVCKNEKDFLFFSRYPYEEIFDAMFVTIEDIQYKKINLEMLTIAEKTVENFYKYNFK